jgi:uncharacterized protein YodC (DUF2158 family)
MRPGDIVKLKSGGPAMTVVAILHRHSTSEPSTVRCGWFNGANYTELSTHVAALELVNAPQ